MNMSYHSLLDYIVLNVSLYTVGSHGPQPCKTISCVCVCVHVLSCNCELAITAFVVIIKGERGKKRKREVELPWDRKE